MGMEHRWGQRQSTNVKVHVVVRSGTTAIARVVNVSLTGAYLETSLPLRLYSLVYLESAMQDNVTSSGKRIAANVIRHDAQGVGLEWCEVLTKGAHIDALLDMLAYGGIVDQNGVVSVETVRRAKELVSRSAARKSSEAPKRRTAA
jgi:hypothetical protein